MRRSEASLAVIGREVDRQPRWLARWNEAWGAYHFVGGHRDLGEAPRACMVREIKEELKLDAGASCWVATDPLAHVEYTAWSERAGADTVYVMDLFAVVVDDSALKQVAEQSNTRWLTAAEVRAGRCEDGRPVSPTMTTLFDRAGIDSKEMASFQSYLENQP